MAIMVNSTQRAYDSTVSWLSDLLEDRDIMADKWDSAKTLLDKAYVAIRQGREDFADQLIDWAYNDLHALATLADDVWPVADDFAA